MFAAKKKLYNNANVLWNVDLHSVDISCILYIYIYILCMIYQFVTCYAFFVAHGMIV